ncbi:MAG TPA: hypothetical protein VN554_02645, partial [Verrucomicrobiae bacterium]|nr:hypothetical protein [Verrucomicrobiae bacterium]
MWPYRLAVAAAGFVAMGSVLFFANRRHDVDTDAALQHALRPTTVRMASKIIKFADAHPGLSDIHAGPEFVEVEVVAANDQDTARLLVDTRRQNGSSTPDPEAVVSVDMLRLG